MIDVAMAKVDLDLLHRPPKLLGAVSAALLVACSDPGDEGLQVGVILSPERRRRLIVERDQQDLVELLQHTLDD